MSITSSNQECGVEPSTSIPSPPPPPPCVPLCTLSWLLHLFCALPLRNSLCYPVSLLPPSCLDPRCPLWGKPVHKPMTRGTHTPAGDWSRHGWLGLFPLPSAVPTRPGAASASQHLTFRKILVFPTFQSLSVPKHRSAIRKVI